MSDDSEYTVPPNQAKRIVRIIGITCGSVVLGLSFCLSYFYGKDSTPFAGYVLISPENLLQVRVTYALPDSEVRGKWILDKIELHFNNLTDSVCIKRLFPEEYGKIFSLIKEDRPLSKSFSETMVWEDTAASIRLYVSCFDQNGFKSSPLIYQKIDFSPDGSLFRVSWPEISPQANSKWIYYHHPGILKALKAQAFSRQS